MDKKRLSNRILRKMKKLILLSVLFWSCSKSNLKEEPKEPDLRLLWSYNTEHSSAPKAEPLLINENVYITGGLALHKVSNKDGSRVWINNVDGTASSLKNYRFIENGNVIIGMQPKKIHGFDLESGENKWTILFPDSIDILELGLGAKFGDFGYFNALNGYISKVNITTGIHEVLIKFPFKIRNINVFDNGDLLIPHEEIHSEEPLSYTAVMGRWSPSAKEWIWKFELNNAGVFSYNYPQIENNIVYSGLTNAGFIALDATTGQEIWKTIKMGLITGFHVLTPDTIYAQARNRVYALNRHTGELLWETTPMGVSESTRIHYKNGYVYWCHNNGIFIYDAKDGKQVHYQRHEYGGYIWTSTMAEDRLLVQTSTHLLAYELFNPEE
ncbi:hypothetical protein EP331_02305 [bacterium]|nr:MAG: hypothetical protein EP331_02305 [bacterium]